MGTRWGWYSHCLKCLWPAIALPCPALYFELVVELHLIANAHIIRLAVALRFSTCSENGVARRCVLGFVGFEPFKILLAQLVLRSPSICISAGNRGEKGASKTDQCKVMYLVPFG